jgi:hypothetical protein
MILRELFYFDPDTIEPTEDNRYEPQYDESPIKKGDTRKTKLTLRQINRIRKASELHNKEAKEELQFVRQMYGIANQAEAGI